MMIGSYRTKKTGTKRYVLHWKSKKIDISENQFNELIYNLRNKLMRR